MHPANMTEFFLWCSVINTGLLLLWALMLLVAPGWVYRTQKAYFPMDESQFRLVFYCLLGFFKMQVIVFNWVPYFALRIMS
jgi:hypothetical protein